MRKFQWFVGQHVFYKRGEVGGVWWGDTGEVLEIRKVGGAIDLAVKMEWGNTVIGAEGVYPLKVVLERNARVLRKQAAEFTRKARDLPRRGS